MSIRVYQIKSDICELVFDPRTDDLRVGENLFLLDEETKRGLVVQVIELCTPSYPSLAREELSLALGMEISDYGLRNGNYGFNSEISTPQSEPRNPQLEFRNLKMALAKVRKVLLYDGATVSTWEEWDGWIPAREVLIRKIPDDEVFHRVMGKGECYPLYLGRTLSGSPFVIDGQDVEKVNIITGVKGSGKSHLAKVLLLQLIAQGAPCLVFDLNREYIHLQPPPAARRPPLKGEIIHLEVGSAGGTGHPLRLSIQQFGLAPLLTMLTRYGLPEVSALYFENRVARLLEEANEMRRQGKRPPFIGIDQLIQMAEEGEFAGGDRSLVINGAIRSRLEALRNTHIFARNPLEAVSLKDYYDRIRHGGALVIDISALSNLARVGFVQAVLETVKEICVSEIAQGTHRFPFIFFEEAHLYVQRNTIDYLVTRARHLGATCFFLTNMITALDEVVLRQADNLFLLRLPFDDDVRHVAKSATTDYETLACFVRRLRRYHCLVIGQCTRYYPLIVAVDPLKGVNTAGETKYFFSSNLKPSNGERLNVATASPLLRRFPPRSAHGEGRSAAMPLL